MTFLRVAVHALSTALLLRISFSRPLDDTQPDKSLLPSEKLSPDDGWADAEWKFPGLDNLIYYNSGPCVNDQISPNHTYTNGTVADATIISIFEDYDAAFKDPASRDRALNQIVADWQPLGIPSKSSLTSVVETGDVVALDAQNTFSRRALLPDSVKRVLKPLAIVSAVALGGFTLGYNIKIFATELNGPYGPGNWDTRDWIAFALMYYLADLAGRMAERFYLRRQEINARAAAQAAVMLPAVRELQQRPEMIEAKRKIETQQLDRLNQVINDIETGRISAEEVQAALPAGFTDGRKVEQKAEEERRTCSLKKDNGTS